MKKKLATTVLATITVLALSGCGAPGDAASPGNEQASTSNSGTVVIYSTESTMPEFAERFKEETGKTLQVVSVSSGQSDARVAAEKSNPQADVVVSGSNPAAVHPELYRKWKGEVDLATVNEKLIGVDAEPEYGIPTMAYPIIFAYNKSALDGNEPPTSWADLADPKWKGKVYSGDPTKSGTAFRALSSVYSAGGWPLVEDFARNIVVTESSLGPMQALANGEAAIGIGAENSVFQVADGETVVAAYPTDGIIVSVGMFYLVKNAPNEQGANAFMEWILSDKTQSWMTAEHKGMRPTTTTATEPSDVPALSTLNLITTPEEANANKAEFLEHWTDIITSVS